VGKVFVDLETLPKQQEERRMTVPFQLANSSEYFQGESHV
jgi:hypothetical protein